ncbi:hypothetical protein ACFYOT_38015 [Saccharothrix saharensis]|uniref:hypothetical protein n=1 Tax=Saccharothrix saharensis TaxID=571190 RepID=UPI0036C55EA6
MIPSRRTRRVLAKRLSNGNVAVALFNQGNGTTTTSGTISAGVPAHGTAVYIVSGGGAPRPRRSRW